MKRDLICVRSSKIKQTGIMSTLQTKRYSSVAPLEEKNRLVNKRFEEHC